MRSWSMVLVTAICLAAFAPGVRAQVGAPSDLSEAVEGVLPSVVTIQGAREVVEAAPGDPALRLWREGRPPGEWEEFRRGPFFPRQPRGRTQARRRQASGIVLDRQGQEVRVKRPHIDPHLCTGCGACEFACPVIDQRAIYVTSVGESRSRRNQILLQRRGKKQNDPQGNS